MIEFPPGTPSWVELGSHDPDASARFYGELLGWEAAAAAGVASAAETGGFEGTRPREPPRTGRASHPREYGSAYAQSSSFCRDCRRADERRMRQGHGQY